MTARDNPRRIPMCIAETLGEGMIRDITLRFFLIEIDLSARERAVLRDAVMEFINDFCDVEYPEKTK